MQLTDHRKPLLEDKEFSTDVMQQDLSQHSFKRLYAVNKTFTEVSFKQSEISHSYFRNCNFNRCDFTGANISYGNFRGSLFTECKFKYSTWEHTQIDESFLDNCLPSEENLARDLVRSLRVNFSQIGNYAAVNKAAMSEVRLTGQHFHHAAYSKQSYYRSKYKGWTRARYACRHAYWKALNLLWGNGESAFRIIGAGVTIVLLWTMFLWLCNPQISWSTSLRAVVYSFWGIAGSSPLPPLQLTLLTAVRYVLFGLFISVLVKRLALR